MQVAIVDYNAGNIYSVVHALRRIGVEPTVTNDAATIQKADRVLFPGQGEASSTMQSLRQSGLDKVLPNLRQPVLGICIGQQLLCAHSEEENTDCLNVFPNVPVQRFKARSREDKIPHMGWNTVDNLSTPLFKDINEGAFVYFIHSFYVPLCDYTIATTEYCGIRYSSALRKNNFFSTQFHPEKSGSIGERLLHNFIDNDILL